MAPTNMPARSSRIWIDVEDFFDYARHVGRPSGIQRLAFEIYRDLQARFGATGQIVFFVHDGPSITEVDYAEIAALFDRLTTAPSKANSSVSLSPDDAESGQSVSRRLYRRLPYGLRPLVKDAVFAQRHAFHAWDRLIRNLVRGLMLRVAPSLVRARGPAADAPPPAQDGLPATAAAAREMAPGDIIFILGSPWSNERYADFLREQKQRHGVKAVLLVYDLIPVRRPEWCDATLVKLFTGWMHAVAPLCDQVFAISRYSAEDFDLYAREQGWTHLAPAIPIPIGTGFGDAPARPKEPVRPAKMPTGDYVLIVSTIEARKNHLLLFRVWRRLLEEMPADEVPTLVFAGRVGWLVADLMQQMKNAGFLGGKLVVIEGPSDDELATLYEGCLFTLFPSFFEGWGLPVTESLAAGKPCLISNRTSLPEAGGGFARAFDPDDLNDAYRVIQAAFTDRAGLAAWEEDIRSRFRPVPWSRASDALLEGIAHPLAPSRQDPAQLR